MTPKHSGFGYLIVGGESTAKATCLISPNCPTTHFICSPPRGRIGFSSCLSGNSFPTVISPSQFKKSTALVFSFDSLQWTSSRMTMSNVMWLSLLSGLSQAPVAQAAEPSLPPQLLRGGDCGRAEQRDQKNGQAQRTPGAAVERRPHPVRARKHACLHTVMHIENSLHNAVD